MNKSELAENQQVIIGIIKDAIKNCEEFAWNKKASNILSDMLENLNSDLDDCLMEYIEEQQGIEDYEKSIERQSKRIIPVSLGYHPFGIPHKVYGGVL